MGVGDEQKTSVKEQRKWDKTRREKCRKKRRLLNKKN